MFWKTTYSKSSIFSERQAYLTGFNFLNFKLHRGSNLEVKIFSVSNASYRFKFEVRNMRIILPKNQTTPVNLISTLLCKRKLLWYCLVLQFFFAGNRCFLDIAKAIIFERTNREIIDYEKNVVIEEKIIEIFKRKPMHKHQSFSCRKIKTMFKEFLRAPLIPIPITRL